VFTALSPVLRDVQRHLAADAEKIAV